MASYTSEGSLRLDPSILLPSRPTINRFLLILTQPFHRLRRARLNIILLPLVCVLIFFVIPLRPPLPPSYGREEMEERWLPQVVSGDGEMERKGNGRFVYFAPIKEAGFNYQLQALILQQHLSFLANRSIAYQPYHIHDSVFPIYPFEWPLTSSRVPMSAMIASVGSGWEGFYEKRRGIPLKHYRDECPYSLRHEISLPITPSTIDNVKPGDEGEAVKMIEGLGKLLEESGERCLEVRFNPFDRGFFESHFPEALYTTLSTSPVIKHFSFSPRVLSIINRSIPYLSPQAERYPEEFMEAERRPERVVPWKNLLALHLRKSSDGRYCESLGERFAPFVGFNKLPNLPGNENVPPPPDTVPATRQGLYMAKCEPPILDIIARARRMRINHPLLNTIYILSNGDYGYVQEARKWLESDGWDRVLISADVVNSWDDREVGEAVDTEIARRAGVFVGNGFSALSSNVALLRTADGRHTDFTQYW